MILFLTGTWGSGKSYVGDLIKEHCGLPHLEADIHFDKRMLGAIHARTFHELDMSAYYNRVISDIFGFQKRADNFVVSQGIYQERFRQEIYSCFDPEIRFVLVETPDEETLKARLIERGSKGNPISPEVYEYMQPYWEDLQIPHQVLVNGENVEEDTRQLVQAIGLCFHWE
jgi:adenylate kinase family enzyme